MSCGKIANNRYKVLPFQWKQYSIYHLPFTSLQFFGADSKEPLWFNLNDCNLWAFSAHILYEACYQHTYKKHRRSTKEQTAFYYYYYYSSQSCYLGWWSTIVWPAIVLKTFAAQQSESVIRQNFIVGTKEVWRW